MKQGREKEEEEDKVQKRKRAKQKQKQNKRRRNIWKTRGQFGDAVQAHAWELIISQRLTPRPSTVTLFDYKQISRELTRVAVSKQDNDVIVWLQEVRMFDHVLAYELGTSFKLNPTTFRKLSFDDTTTIFRLALSINDLVTVQYMMEKKICGPNAWANHAILTATRYGNMKLLEILLKQPEINRRFMKNIVTAGVGHADVLERIRREFPCIFETTTNKNPKNVGVCVRQKEVDKVLGSDSCS